jgi:hypothetical protein
LGKRADESWRGADRALELDAPGGQVALQYRPRAGALDPDRADPRGQGRQREALVVRLRAVHVFSVARSFPARDVHDSFKPPPCGPP